MIVIDAAFVMSLILHTFVSALALKITAAIMPGFEIKSFPTAIWAALILSVLNVYIRPLLIFLTIPLTILTLGLFLLVVNAMVLRLCASFLADFKISGWLAAIAGGVVLSITNSILEWLLL